MSDWQAFALWSPLGKYCAWNSKQILKIKKKKKKKTRRHNIEKDSLLQNCFSPCTLVGRNNSTTQLETEKLKKPGKFQTAHVASSFVTSNFVRSYLTVFAACLWRKAGNAVGSNVLRWSQNNNLKKKKKKSSFPRSSVSLTSSPDHSSCTVRSSSTSSFFHDFFKRFRKSVIICA
jgi:hypothetical protein